jgi:hypothetical protein
VRAWRCFKRLSGSRPVVNAACISFMLVVVDDLATVGIYSFIGGVLILVS